MGMFGTGRRKPHPNVFARAADDTYRSYGGAVVDALGDTADLFNNPFNAAMHWARVPYRQPSGALQAAVPQPTNIFGDAARFVGAMAIPVPGAKARAGAGMFGAAKRSADRIVGYHGTTGDFAEFALPGRTGKATGGRKSGGNAVYIAENPETANYFARGEGANVRKVVAEVPVFDPANPAQLAELEPFLRKNFGTKVARGALYSVETALDWMRKGDYGLLEDPGVVQFLKRKGYGGVRMQEQPGKATWAVFDPSTIRHAFER